MRPFTQGLRPSRSLLTQASSLTSTRTRSRLFSSQLSELHKPSSTPFYNQPRRALPFTSFRQNSSSSRPLTEDLANKPETDTEREAKNTERRNKEEAYRITFTCKPCGERSAHRMSKQGYHRGTVLIQCPSCKNRHVMSDHLGVFFDKRTTVEDLLKQQGQALTHGHTDGNLEFWEDGTVRQIA